MGVEGECRCSRSEQRPDDATGMHAGDTGRTLVVVSWGQRRTVAFPLQDVQSREKDERDPLGLQGWASDTLVREMQAGISSCQKDRIGNVMPCLECSSSDESR